MNVSNAKKYLGWVGSGLGIIGVVFVVSKLIEYSAQLDDTLFNTKLIIASIALIIVYCIINLLLSFAWRDILEYFGVNTSLRWAVETYGVSQLAKYVPGNVFHLASRQAIGVSSGISNIPLGKSALWEILLLILAGSLFVVLNLKLFEINVSEISMVMMFSVLIGVCCLIAYLKYGRLITRAILFHAGFLVITGMIFVAVLMLVSANDIYYMSISIGGAYVIAWLVGFISPGAPAGVGIREMVLFSLLSANVSQVDLVAAITISRIITVFGDVAFYLIAIGMRRST